MPRIALVDYCHPKDGYANRDQTGTFGSKMHARGIIGKLVTQLKKDGLRIPNMSLATLAAIIREEKGECKIYNGMPQDEEIVIIATSMYQYKNEITLARTIRKQNPGVKIGFIGAFSSVEHSHFESVADFIIIGEPELAIRHYCQGKLELKGHIDIKEEVDVKTLPHPDWRGLDVESFGYFPALLKKPFFPMQASRGCPFNCEFCPYMVMQKAPLRRRDNEDVIAEMRHLVNKFGAKSILFRDITFSMHKRLTKDLCRMISDEKFDLEIAVETRLDCVDDEMVELMAAAGVKAINVGIESPSDDIVTESGRRPIGANHTERMVRLLEERGIRVQAFYILGLIGDTVESMKKTVEYSQFLNTFSAQFCVLTPFPGTPTMDRLKDRLLTTDYSKFTEYDPVVRIDGVSPEQLTALRDKAFNSYYLRPSWILKHGIPFAIEIVKASMQNLVNSIFTKKPRIVEVQP